MNEIEWKYKKMNENIFF